MNAEIIRLKFIRLWGTMYCLFCAYFEPKLTTLDTEFTYEIWFNPVSPLGTVHFGLFPVTPCDIFPSIICPHWTVTPGWQTAWTNGPHS